MVDGWAHLLEVVVPGDETHAFIMEGDAMVDLNDRISEADRSLYELVPVGGINATGRLAVTAKRRADSATVVRLLVDTRSSHPKASSCWRTLAPSSRASIRSRRAPN
jgi:hypothetical protein